MKTNSAERERSRLRTEYATRRHPCRARVPGVCNLFADEWHEIERRSQGGSITDIGGNVLDCCFACHRWIHANPGAARKRGLLRKKVGE